MYMPVSTSTFILILNILRVSRPCITVFCALFNILNIISSGYTRGTPVVSSDTKKPGDVGCSLYEVYDQTSLDMVNAAIAANGENRNFWVGGSISGSVITFSDGSKYPVDSSLFQPNEPNGSGSCLHLW